MAGNTTTKKAFNSVKSEIAPDYGFNSNAKTSTKSTKNVNYKNSSGMAEGQLASRPMEKFAQPMNDGVNASITSIQGVHNDIGEMSGFITDGYHDKGGTVYGEAAKLNFLPPGMDISNQENSEQHDMPMRVYGGGVSYPDDGWAPKPRDLKE